MASLGRGQYSDPTSGSTGRQLYRPSGWFDLTTGLTKREWVDIKFPVMVQDELLKIPSLFGYGIHFANQTPSTYGYFLYRAKHDRNGTLQKSSSTPLEWFELYGGSAFSWICPPSGYVVDILGPLVTRKDLTLADTLVLWDGLRLDRIQGKLITVVQEANYPPVIHISQFDGTDPGKWCCIRNESRHTITVNLSRPRNIAGMTNINSLNSNSFISDAGGKRIFDYTIEPMGELEFEPPTRFFFVEVCESKNTENGGNSNQKSPWIGDDTPESDTPTNKVVLTSVCVQKGDMVVTLNGPGGGTSPVIDVVVTLPIKVTLITQRMVLNANGIPIYDPATNK